MNSGISYNKVSAVIVAAGQGSRSGQVLPKQFALWRGKPVLRHSIEAFTSLGISPIAIAIPEGSAPTVRAILSGIDNILLVHGGDTRQESVLLALEALAPTTPEQVLIHDAARPIVPGSVVDRLVQALAISKAAIPVLPVADSMIHAEANIMGAPADRDHLRRVQTPQAFHYAAICAAHEQWKGPKNAGDDAQVAQMAGLEVTLVDGDEALHKLTYAHDFQQSLPAFRVGSGYDVHRLAEGEELWLGGVRIDHTHGLSGHSDADVVIHALVDALLGAVGAGDIGQHFPPSDEKWRGASSDRFLQHAVSLVEQEGYRTSNVDLTIICEAPKIGPHRENMRQRLAEILGVDISAVSVKATTTEKLGFTGRGEGIAAQAIATIVRQ